MVLSFETVAAIVAVAPGAIVVGGAVLRAIDMLGGVVVPVVVPDDDEVAPQPEKYIAINRTLARAKNPHFDDTRIFCTLVSSLN